MTACTGIAMQLGLAIANRVVEMKSHIFHHSHQIPDSWIPVPHDLEIISKVQKIALGVGTTTSVAPICR